jgi:hypothetical protein
MSNWKITVGVLLVLLLAGLVWTTRFKYGEMHHGSQIIDVRTNRYTDETERLTMAGWIVMAPADPTLSVDHTDRDLQIEKCVMTTETHKAFVECVDKVLP